MPAQNIKLISRFKLLFVLGILLFYSTMLLAVIPGEHPQTVLFILYGERFPSNKICKVKFEVIGNTYSKLIPKGNNILYHLSPKTRFVADLKLPLKSKLKIGQTIVADVRSLSGGMGKNMKTSYYLAEATMKVLNDPSDSQEFPLALFEKYPPLYIALALIIPAGLFLLIKTALSKKESLPEPELKKSQDP
jgi:hypothetical protein